MDGEIITSVQNPQVKRWCQLHSRKGREEQGSFLVEGVHLVEEALRSEKTVTAIIYDSERGIDPVVAKALAGQNDVRQIAASAAVMAKLSETRTPQGIAAEVMLEPANWDRWWDRQANRDFLLLLLDGVQDPGNLGTIIRTAEAAGADAVVIGSGSVDLYNSKVVRATMGSIFRLPVFAYELVQLAGLLKAAGASLLVTALDPASRSYDEPLYRGKTAIVIGSEARGVSDVMLAEATHKVHIPLSGQAESLNAAVAAGVILYEARRQRLP
ncbi:TrmH family RNA methyltransferase [Brevibacillus sp. B_LB10_24]|uniref:TrmH family RNA methyltransferase n=1 Tax=Brevibacillus sp. B_LB10_24 TaxID=3380645 RepID=UPI0038BBFA41